MNGNTSGGPDLSRAVGSRLRRFNDTLRNGLEVMRFGGLNRDEEGAPYRVERTRPMYRLRHYFADQVEDGALPRLLLVPPLMVDTSIYDVSQKVSSVRALNRLGVDSWVIDFGAPEHEEGGMERSLTDHVLAVSDCIDYLRERYGADVHIAGYSQGGLFCYMTAAMRKCDGVASVAAFGSPVDLSKNIPPLIPEELFTRTADFVINGFVRSRGLPGWLIGLGFQGLDPAATVRNRIQFLKQLHNREALLPREGQRRFIEGEGFVGYAGPAVAELVSMTLAANRLMSGGFDFLGQTVTLADITCPTLVFLSPADAIAPPAAVRAIRQAAPLAPLYEVGMSGGHMGLVSSTSANNVAWPAMADWLKWHDDGGEPQKRPASIAPWNDDWQDESVDASTQQLSDAADLVGSIVAEMGRTVGRSLRNSARTIGGLGEEIREQLPNMLRLGTIRPSTRVSMALLLDEQGEDAPDNVAMLFGDRSHTFKAVNERIDNVVRGLISVGVRRGEAVGVLMSTRPSALSVVAALNRLGAVAVLMRPDGDVALEARLAGIRRVIAEPEQVEICLEELEMPVYVLGGGGDARDLDARVIDMEQIDPAAVQLPRWYTPNPGRARDPAFLLFSGVGSQMRVNRVSNGRWALSAFGAASAASIAPTDTVFGTTIHYHPSGLMTTFGCAIAGGARLALTDRFRPETFWEEVRRYGATIVSYTWTSLHEVINAPPSPLEKHSPVRLLIGSGMPVSLWRRAQQRFAPARVVEFYASTEGEAVLVNVDGANIGSKGRPLPGGARLRLVACDPYSGRLEEGPDGYARLASEGEIGMLVAGVTTGNNQPGVLRSLFARGDAWLPTGDLFRRIDGEYWMVGTPRQMLRSAAGPVAAQPLEDALGLLDAVDLASVFAVSGDTGPCLLAVVTQVPGMTLTAGDLDDALADFPVEARPRCVMIADDIPVTSWYRLNPAALNIHELPGKGAGAPLFRLDSASGRYQPD